MAKVSKRYAEAAKLVDRSKTYSIEEAVKLAKETSKTKFDASVEVSFRLNVDPRHADQQIRGAMVLPNGTGKTQRVCVVAQGEKKLRLLVLISLVVQILSKKSLKVGSILMY